MKFWDLLFCGKRTGEEAHSNSCEMTSLPLDILGKPRIA
jgi:hypothetical protein